MIPGDILSAFPHRQFHTLPGLLDSLAALPNSYPNALRAMQGGSLYHFYDGLWYDPAKRRRFPERFPFRLQCEHTTTGLTLTRARLKRHVHTPNTEFFLAHGCLVGYLLYTTVIIQRVYPSMLSGKKDINENN